jgi:pimeloyl-ACP methyl ester carboxylesterase
MARNHRPREIGAWTDAGAERVFRALEDELAAELWNGGLLHVTVETRHGVTHLYHRPGTGSPAVFLPGMGAPALMWRPELVAGLRDRPVYLVDTIGDVGRSVQAVPLDRPEDVADWLDDVLGDLALGRVDLVGASYGGWVALNQARRSPARLRSIALVEPVGVVELDMRRFLVWGIACGLASLAPAPIRRRAAVRLRQGAITDARARRLGRLAYTRHRFHLPRPHTLSDGELAAVTTPALVLMGERSEIHDSARALDRVRSCLPAVEAELVPGAGHSLPVDRAELVGRRLGTFHAGRADVAG